MFKGWRTIGFNVGLAVLGVLQATDWTSVLGNDPRVGWIVTGIGVIGAVLRAKTDTAIGEKE